MSASSDGDRGTRRNSMFGNKWLVLVATSVGLFVVIIDNTVVNISIPSMIVNLQTNLAHVEWVLNAYTLAFASLLITFGRLGDMYGRRRMFLVGLVVFGVGSAACGLAPTATALIAFRVFQAFGAAFMLPATLSLTEVNFPPEQRGTAFGVWGAISGFALGVGPTLGGLLTQFSWRYIFFINVPIVAFAIPFTMLVVPESTGERGHRLDWPGVTLSIAMLVAFNYAMIEGPSRNWDGLVTGLLAASAILLAVFLWWERRAAEPLIDLKLFRSSTFAVGNLVGVLLLFTMIGVFFLLPLFLQTVLRFDALRTGLAIAPMSLALMIVGPIAGHYSDRVGPRWLMFAGMLTISAGILSISFLSPSTSVASLAPKFVLTGAGMGLVISPMTSAVMGAAPIERAGSASGILATMRQVGAVMGIAVLGAVLQASVVTGFTQQLAARPDITAEQAKAIVTADQNSRSGLIGGSPSSTLAGSPKATEVGVAYKTAFIDAVSVTFRVAASITLLGALLSLLIAPMRGRAGPAVAPGMAG